MSELDKLILSCQEYFKVGDPCIKKVKRPQLLIRFLKELRDDIIGLDKVKDAIATQIMYLISDESGGQQMLHTVLYGPPGVGKTSIGIKLAKIWYALGYLEVNTSKTGQGAGNRGGEDDTPITINGLGTGNSLKKNLNVEAISLILLCVYVLSSIVKSGMSSYGFYVLILFGIGLLVYGIYTMNKNRKPSEGSKKGDIVDNVSGDTKPGSNRTGSNRSNSSTKEPPFDDSSIIKVVSRSDFVSGYLGQSALKTKKLLTDNLGKVLFIDEAYSLLNDHVDPYGMEALTTLNLFMSENPDKIVCIFAGYKNLMQNGVFKHQPGLVRRCMWHFECEGYSPLELFRIFKLQVAKNGKRLTDTVETLNLITQNYDVFTAYAGDTEKLFFFAQLEATRDKFGGTSPRTVSRETNSSSSESVVVSANDITPRHIELGISKLRENNINKDATSNKTALEKLLEQYTKASA